MLIHQAPNAVEFRYIERVNWLIVGHVRMLAISALAHKSAVWPAISAMLMALSLVNSSRRAWALALAY